MVYVPDSEPRILIIEENEYHGLLMERQIARRMEGSTVVIAACADEALRYARLQKFDVAVVDFVLGDCDGLTLLRSLHQIDPDLAVIVVAEDITETITKEAFRNGCVELLVKDSTYYAVIPRMVAGLYLKQCTCGSRHRPNKRDTSSVLSERGRPAEKITVDKLDDPLDTILRATKQILDRADETDLDVARRVQAIRESTMRIKLSLDRNLAHARRSSVPDGQNRRKTPDFKGKTDG